MPSKKKVAPSKPSPSTVMAGVRMQPAEYERMRQAAASRGWSFNAFAVRALLEAADYILKQPRADGIFPPTPSIPVQPAGGAPSISDAA